MAYNPATATALLVGGASNYPSPVITPQYGTWSWNGVTWTKLSLASSSPTAPGC
jgi:hypothetical protein